VTRANIEQDHHDTDEELVLIQSYKVLQHCLRLRFYTRTGTDAVDVAGWTPPTIWTGGAGVVDIAVPAPAIVIGVGEGFGGATETAGAVPTGVVTVGVGVGTTGVTAGTAGGTTNPSHELNMQRT